MFIIITHIRFLLHRPNHCLRQVTTRSTTVTLGHRYIQGNIGNTFFSMKHFIYASHRCRYRYIQFKITIKCTVVPATRGHCRFGAKVSPRGRDRNFDTNIYGHTSSAHIVYALLMHEQNRSGGYENGKIPIT